MLFGHMSIAGNAFLKDGQTNPADVSLASSTCHMIAAFRLFHWRLTLRAVLDIELFFQFLEGFVTAGCNIFVLRTSIVAVSGMAGSAIRLEAIRASVSQGLHSFSRSTSVDVAAARSWAVAKFFRVALNVFFEGRLEHIFQNRR